MKKMFKKSHSRSSSTGRSDGSEYDIPIGKMQPAKQALQSQQTSKGSSSRSRTSSDGGSHSSSNYRPYQSSSLSRTVNPMNYPLDNLTALSIALSGNSPYSAENITLPTRQNVHHAKSASTNSSPSNHGGRAASLQNVAARDRSLDRLEREYLMIGERSLDRHGMDRIQLMTREGSAASLIDTRRGYNTTGHGRDRSLDREYPHMGARSLEREHHIPSRSRSNDRSDLDPMSSSLLAGSLSPQEYRNSFMFDLQVQITELHKECAKLQRELDNANAKLCSSMNSIKTFWSPELKKERTIRKDETARYVMLNEQFKIAQAELQKKEDLLKKFETNGSSTSETLPTLHISTSPDTTDRLTNDKQAKEILILRKTVDEMELRIETQKQTLSARDESIKKLLEMLQSKGLSVKQFDEDRQQVESLKCKIIEAEKRIKQLETLLEQKDLEVGKLKESHINSVDSGVSLNTTNDNTHTMQAIIEAKDSRISSLEQEVQTLEDKILKMQEENFTIERRDGTLTKDNNQSTKEKELRAELEKLRNKLSERETTLEGLKLKVETVQRQQTEKDQYVSVLKEQISAKELHSSMLQADIEDLKDRVKDKEGTIERKSKESYSFNKDKRRLEGEIAELKDLLDVKERKISVLQRKLENLEETNKQKDEQLDLAKSRNLAIFTNSDSSPGLEDALLEKDKQIERLKEQRDRTHQDHCEETEQVQKNLQELKSQLEQLQQELNSKQTELVELREEVAELKSDKFKADTKIRQLDAELQQKKEEIDRLVDKHTDETNQEVQSKEQTESSEKHLMQLQGSVTQSQNEALQARQEVDRLTEELKNSETDREEKDNKIKELNDIVKEYKQKMGTLKRSQQSEKKKNAQLLEEAWKREVNLNEDSSQLLSEVDQKSNRIEELEEALRQSVKITAEREMDMAEQQQELEETKAKITELKTEIDTLRTSTADQNGKVNSLNKILEEKDVKLRKLQAERFRHLDEVFEMKQEAIQAAISEKDANIALLEMTSTKAKRNTEEISKLNKEKVKLQEQLKDVTQNRIKLASKDDKSKDRKRLSPQKPKSSDKIDPPYQLSDTTAES